MSGYETLRVVWAAVPAVWSEALMDALSEQGLQAATWEDVERQESRIQVFLALEADAAAAADTLSAIGSSFGLTLAPLTQELPAQDWTESWKRFFHVTRVSPAVVVRPPWEDYAAAPGECVIVIDPGMSFGTGRHGTTQACLQFLDAIAAEGTDRQVLDIGCGSGILSIGAARLGFRDVTGFDCDADAVRNAAENVALNGVAVRLEVDDLATSRRQAEVVVANILASVLIEHAASVAGAVRAGGTLVISGILDAQYSDVLAAFTRLGFHERRSVLIEGWRSGWLAR